MSKTKRRCLVRFNVRSTILDAPQFRQAGFTTKGVHACGRRTCILENILVESKVDKSKTKVSKRALKYIKRWLSQNAVSVSKAKHKSSAASQLDIHRPYLEVVSWLQMGTFGKRNIPRAESIIQGTGGAFLFFRLQLSIKKPVDLATFQSTRAFRNQSYTLLSITDATPICLRAVPPAIRLLERDARRGVLAHSGKKNDVIRKLVNILDI